MPFSRGATLNSSLTTVSWMFNKCCWRFFCRSAGAFGKSSSTDFCMMISARWSEFASGCTEQPESLSVVPASDTPKYSASSWRVTSSPVGQRPSWWLVVVRTSSGGLSSLGANLLYPFRETARSLAKGKRGCPGCNCGNIIDKRIDRCLISHEGP